MTAPALATARLRLEPLGPQHAAALAGPFADPEALRYWHHGPHETPAETTTMLANMAKNDVGWVLMPKGGKDAIGFVYFLGNEGPRGMGYFLAREHWGKGLMAEAVAAALAYGFDGLGLDRVELWIDARNLRSQHLAERCGFARRGAFLQRSDGVETLVYGLRATERGQAGQPSAGPARAYGLTATLKAPDVKATAAFYRDRLGFRIGFTVGDPLRYAGVVLEEWTGTGAHIHLERVRAKVDPTAVALTIPVGPGIDELHARYRSRGVTIVEPPNTTDWGARQFEIHDCNGYSLTFTTPA